MTPSPSSRVTVVVPTVDGREHHLARLKAALRQTAPEATLHVYRNRSTCGEVWNIGAQYATTELVAMLADDLEPLEGWVEAAIATVEIGCVPAPYIWTMQLADPTDPAPARTFESGGGWHEQMPAGSPTGWAAIPFCRREWWVDIPAIHYFSDNAYTDAQRIKGRPAIVQPGFAFNHHWAQPGRKPMQGPDWYREEAAWSAYRREQLEQAAGRA